MPPTLSVAVDVVAGLVPMMMMMMMMMTMTMTMMMMMMMMEKTVWMLMLMTVVGVRPNSRSAKCAAPAAAAAASVRKSDAIGSPRPAWHTNQPSRCLHTRKINTVKLHPPTHT
jgi:hypothetical protein